MTDYRGRQKMPALIGARATPVEAAGTFPDVVRPSMKRWGMNRSWMTMFAAATVLVVGACAPDDDQAEVQQVDEVHTPAPVMPEDTMMMHGDTLDHNMRGDTLRDTIPQQ
jgi:hypothetical protein